MLHCRFALLALLATPCAYAQINMNMGEPSGSFVENVLRHTGSGTSLEPASSDPPMLMQMRPNGWIALYLFPTALAYHRDCEAVVWIALVNVFLGWTIFGWFVSIGWAAAGKARTLPPRIPTHPVPSH